MLGCFSIVLLEQVSDDNEWMESFLTRVLSLNDDILFG